MRVDEMNDKTSRPLRRSSTSFTQTIPARSSRRASVRAGRRSSRGTTKRVVGFLLGTFVDYGLDHESSGTLEQLVVDGGTRGDGVGRALVENWKAWLQSEAITLAFLSVEPAAVPFYEKCGFSLCTGPYMVWSA